MSCFVKFKFVLSWIKFFIWYFCSNQNTIVQANLRLRVLI